MADTFTISFRIEEMTVAGKSYNDRYEELTERIKTLAENYWEETTSYFIASFDMKIDALAKELKKCISPAHDLVLITKTEYKSARIMGNYEDEDIFDLIPFLKKS